MSKPLPMRAILEPAFIERFWGRVDRSLEGCWEWAGLVSVTGRALVHLPQSRRSYYAYRVSYAITHRTDPAALLVCHHCDNPRCVRPDHLFLGTHADNMADMRAKGRCVRTTTISGELHPASVLTDAQIAEIRVLYATGAHTQAELARKYGVSQTSVGGWVRGQHRAGAVGPRIVVGKGRNGARQFPGKPRIRVPCAHADCADVAVVKGQCRPHYFRAWKDARRLVDIEERRTG